MSALWPLFKFAGLSIAAQTGGRDPCTVVGMSALLAWNVLCLLESSMVINALLEGVGECGAA